MFLGRYCASIVRDSLFFFSWQIFDFHCRLLSFTPPLLLLGTKSLACHQQPCEKSIFQHLDSFAVTIPLDDIKLLKPTLAPCCYRRELCWYKLSLETGEQTDGFHSMGKLSTVRHNSVETFTFRNNDETNTSSLWIICVCMLCGNSLKPFQINPQLDK